MMITDNGYFEGPDHDISWHNVDSEFNGFAAKQLEQSDTLVFGRRTYQLMADFWPTKEAKEADSKTARYLNTYRKIVFSKTLKAVDWSGSELYSGNVDQVIKRLKAEPGKDIAVFGSSNLSLTLIKNKLLDEIRLMVNPVVIPSGTPLFAGLDQPHKFTLKSSRSFKSGNVLLTYGI